MDIWSLFSIFHVCGTSHPTLQTSQFLSLQHKYSLSNVQYTRYYLIHVFLWLQHLKPFKLAFYFGARKKLLRIKRGKLVQQIWHTQFIQCGNAQGLSVFLSCHWRKREVGIFSIVQAWELYSLLIRLLHHFSPWHSSVWYFDHLWFMFPLAKYDVLSWGDGIIFSQNAYCKWLN